MTEPDLRVGIDLGGTKIELAALDRTGTIRHRNRVATPKDYETLLNTVADMLASARQEIGTVVSRFGIGIPGSLSPATGLVRNSNSTCLNDRPFVRDLQAATGCSVRLENDANCFALAEAHSGAGTNARLVMGVIIGTGVGGGIVDDGKLIVGRNGIAGEWGHTRLAPSGPDEHPGPQCDCGRFGCVEAWCCGPALARDHLMRTGAEMDVEMIAAFAAAGDGEAQLTLDTHVERLGRALSGVVNVLDPDVIVLGGGLSNLADLPRRLGNAMRPHIFSDVFETPILKNALGDSAGVIGAAQLWPEGDRT